MASEGITGFWMCTVLYISTLINDELSQIM